MEVETYLVLALFINLLFSTFIKHNKFIGYTLGSLCALIPLLMLSLNGIFVLLFIGVWGAISIINFKEILSDERSSFEHLATLVACIVALSSESFFTLLLVTAFLFLVRLRSTKSMIHILGVSNPLILDLGVFTAFSILLLIHFKLGLAAMTGSFLVILLMVHSLVLSLPVKTYDLFSRFVSCLVQPLVFLKFISLFKASAEIELNVFMLILLLMSIATLIMKEVLYTPKISNQQRVFQMNTLILYIVTLFFSSIPLGSLVFAICINFVCYSLIVNDWVTIKYKSFLSILMAIAPILIITYLNGGEIITFSNEFSPQITFLLGVLIFLPLLLHVNLVRGFDEKV